MTKTAQLVKILTLGCGELQRLATTKKIAKQLLSFNLISYRKLCACLAWSFLVLENIQMNESGSKIDEVKKLVSKEFSVETEKLTNGTRLSHDLGLDGDDAWEFMQVFSEHFQVDMTEFSFLLYFGEEGGADPITLIYFLLVKSARPKFIPITIFDLANSAEQKNWIKPNAEACA